jgi:cysteine-rich repeat protein
MNATGVCQFNCPENFYCDGTIMNKCPNETSSNTLSSSVSNCSCIGNKVWTDKTCACASGYYNLGQTLYDNKFETLSDIDKVPNAYYASLVTDKSECKSGKCSSWLGQSIDTNTLPDPNIFSISFWVKINTIYNSVSYLRIRRPDFTGVLVDPANYTKDKDEIKLYSLLGNSFNFNSRMNNPYAVSRPPLAGANTLMPKSWYHIAFSFSYGKLRFYTNGVDCGEITYTFTPGNVVITFFDKDTDAFPVFIDEFAMFSTEMTFNEALQLMKGPLTYCFTCNANNYCTGDGKQTKCPGNMISSPGASSVSMCKCPDGSTLVNDECVDCPIGTIEVLGACQPCPPNSYCPFEGSTEALATPDFWVRAQKTPDLLLSQARIGKTSITPFPPTHDAILDSPNFLPLCGNGRLDTKADYIAYYADENNLPVTLTKQQLLYQYSNGNGQQGNDQQMLHNITIFADEECDDGNRLDLDGCSADCMNMDLWTSPCEIAVNDTSLLYEDIVYDPTRKSMVVSARDGIYALQLSSGDTFMRAALLAPKSFPVTNIFRQNDSLILYSSKHQAFWQLLDGDSSIVMVRNLSGVGEGLLSEWSDRGHSNADGSIIIHDSTQILFFQTPFSAPTSCNSNGALHKCSFIQSQQGISVLRCDNYVTTVSVVIGNSVCQIAPPPAFQAGDHSFLYDALEMTSRQTGIMRVIPYSMDITISPPQELNKQFNYVQMYNPWGVLVEYPITTARKFGSDPLSPNRMNFVGDASLLRALALYDDSACGQVFCGLDTKVGYDILKPNPQKGAAPLTWGDFLQGIVLKEARKTPSLQTLSSIKANKGIYTNFISTFTAKFKQITAPLTVSTLQKHPESRNLWVLRSDKLVEISKSGVQLQRSDGKCIPVGVALCPACQWAPIGTKCRPCSQTDMNSWAWNAKCKTKACSGRRLLGAGDGTTTIRFTLTGNYSVVSSIWPNAIANDSLYDITVVTSDPLAEMRQIRESLERIIVDAQVITQPYESILLAESIQVSSTPKPTTSTTVSPTTSEPVGAPLTTHVSSTTPPPTTISDSSTTSAALLPTVEPTTTQTVPSTTTIPSTTKVPSTTSVKPLPEVVPTTTVGSTTAVPPTPTISSTSDNSGVELIVFVPTFVIVTLIVVFRARNSANNDRSGSRGYSPIDTVQIPYAGSGIPFTRAAYPNPVHIGHRQNNPIYYR